MVSTLGVSSFPAASTTIRLEANHLTSPVVKCNHKSDWVSTLAYKTGLAQKAGWNSGGRLNIETGYWYGQERRNV